jgi:enterochelin esterase family protein
MRARARRGEARLIRFESDVLRGNPAGDAHLRTVPVYLPPSYDHAPERRYPVVFILSGFLGRGRMMLNDDPWRSPIDERMDALIEQGSGEMILVMPDCFTRFGGSQYVNSSATGRYEDHVVDELVPWVDRTFRTLASRDHRGVAGKSSGGYGALTLGMKHPGVFGAVACHSGDLCFDYCYRGDIPRFCTEVQRAGGLEAWYEGFQRKTQRKHEDFLTLNILGMAASYSPNPATPPFGIDVPCDLASGEFLPDVWRRWMAFDPLEMLDAHADALRSMKLLYFDCGTTDEFHLHHGARMLARRLTRAGIAHEHEEFDDGHMNIAYRYDVSLPKLAAALGGEKE